MKKENIKSSFLSKGFVDLGEILNKNNCSDLLNNVQATRKWSKDLFRSENEVLKDPQIKKTNPGKGVCNLAESYDLSFIENNENFKEALELIVGKEYEVILKKFVVGMSDSWIPEWLKPRISKKLVANLGPFIKKEYRDVTYFRGIDYHMDLIDPQGSIGDYITLYVYLNDVNKKMSPLHLIEGSHIFGATKFPHHIKLNPKLENKIEYGSTKNNMKKLNKKILTGKSGTVYLWSAMTLHGTIPMDSDLPRISLRYTIQMNQKLKNNQALVRKLLEETKGGLRLKVMRDDVDHKSKNLNQIKFNKVLK